ncbi:MAG: DNA topoisomerase I [Candidatus ainarchaeum sp.]|nr:DNA topoisomerase I [Candidatus ainarchaeum sp.]
MQLIISEKAIAGERIASLLADGKVLQKTVLNARVFDFDWNGVQTRVIPLRGHICDVEFPKEYSSWSAVPLEKLILAPVIYSRKEFRIIDCIIDSALNADSLIIATDADREGEAIGLEAIDYALKSNKEIKIKRAYFSAITKEDIQKSFSNLEKFDYNFAYSANARREIDLIWGAVLTRFISLASGLLGKNFLSVGRVQTPTLALIVDREKERKLFVSKKYWEISADCEKDGMFVATHKIDKFWEKENADKIISKNIKELTVVKIDEKEKILKKPVPFNTTELLRSATNIGFSAGRAMDIAESLYQKGFTSYPRTDNKTYPASLDLKEIVNKLASVPEFVDSVNKVLSQKKIVPSADKETKDHPPIHPVLGVKKDVLSKEEWKIYELICRRFLATLYKNAITANVSVLMTGKEEEFVARGQTIVDAGWKSIYFYSKLSEVILPKLSVGDVIGVLKINLFEKSTLPPARYSQSSLLKLMETHNLGTKSTRPNIIQKLYSRNYIIGSKSIEASEIAISVIESLENNCDIVTKPEMTAQLENEMDEIAAGKKDIKSVVEDSSKNLKKILDTLQKQKNNIRLDIRKASFDSNIINQCKKCGIGNLIIRKGKTGKRFVGCSNYPKCDNSFPLPQNGIITTTIELCAECGRPVIKIKNGKFEYKMCLDMNCKTKESWKKFDKKNDSLDKKKNNFVASKKNTGNIVKKSSINNKKLIYKKSNSSKNKITK